MSTRTQNQFTGNSTREDVDRNKLKVRSSCALIIHEVLYVIDFQHNLYSKVVLLGLGFSFSFSGNKLDIYFDSNSFGHGYLSDSFIKLCFNDSISSFSLLMRTLSMLNSTYTWIYWK